MVLVKPVLMYSGLRTQHLFSCLSDDFLEGSPFIYAIIRWIQTFLEFLV